MSENKKIDLGAFFSNRLGHPIGRGVASALWKSQWVRRKAAENPELATIVSEGLVAFTSLLEFGGDHPIARFANFLSETIATENLELLHEFEADPDDPELRKRVEALEGAGDAALAKAEADGVIVVFDHIHKDKTCLPVAQYVADTTPPARPAKDGKVFANPSTARIVSTTMKSALASGIPFCGRCYPAAPATAHAAKAEPAKQVAPGRNFMEHLMRLQKEEPKAYEKFWTTYLQRLDGPDGPDLARKFQEAFNGKFDYAAFRFVVGLPHRNELGDEEWHHALDALLGKITPPSHLKDKIGGILSKELQETEEMFKHIFAWVDRSNAKRSEKIAEKKASVAKKREAFKQMVADRKASQTKQKYLVLVLLAVLVGWYLIQRDGDVANDRSDTSEQKKESAHVR